MRRCTTAPDAAQIHRLALQAWAGIPEALRRHTQGVVFRVEEFCDDEIAREMALESPFDLLGLYQGIPLDQKSVGHSGAAPDMIFLYRRPLLDYWCESGETLEDVVRHVIIHEIGHHFGLSDADMARIEAEG